MLAAIALAAAYQPEAHPFRAKYREEDGRVLADAALHSNADLPRHCDLAVVGAGWGGVYAAWRMSIDTTTVSPDRVCVFEANGRVGGRILSVHGLPHFGDLALDVGGYR